MPIWAQTEKPDNSPEEAKRGGAWLVILLLPFDCLLLAALLTAEIVGRFWRRVNPKIRPSFLPPAPQCSFVILSWNSQALLAESVPPLLTELRTTGGNHEVIVVDNHSTDGTDEYIQRHFPEVRLLRADENLYFSAGNRLGIRAATRDVLVLLNSDTIVKPGFLKPLLAALSQPEVFGAASQVLSHDETANAHARFNGTRIEWRQEIVSASTGKSEWPVLWLHRGLFAVDRRKYLWLGGLDSLYDPLYLEDADLSYRAWKAGWKCVLVPESQVLHHHQVNVPTAGEGFVHMFVRRNQYLFAWKNISSISMLTRIVLFDTGTRLRRAALPGIGTWREMHTFFAALKRLPSVIVRRLQLARRRMRSDEEVFTKSAMQPGCTPHPILEARTTANGSELS